MGSLCLCILYIHHHTILYCTILYYTTPYCTTLYYTIIYHTVLYFTIPCHTVLYYIITCHIADYLGPLDSTWLGRSSRVAFKLCLRALRSSRRSRAFEQQRQRPSPEHSAGRIKAVLYEPWSKLLIRGFYTGYIGSLFKEYEDLCQEFGPLLI